MMSLGFRRRGTLFRSLTLTLLLPLGCFLLNGPLAASLAYADSSRRTALLTTAKIQGIDPEILLNPQGWARKQQALAEQKRKDTIASLPSANTPGWLTKASHEVGRVQAIHSVAAALADVSAGDKRAVDRLAPEARALYDEARRSKATVAGKGIGEKTGRVRAALKLAEPPATEAEGAKDAASSLTGAPLVALPNMHGPSQSPIEQSVDADTQATIDAQSSHALIVAKAQALASDAIRIYNFVHDTIETEMYFGSKKGAVGTLREGRGNDVDQASLLVALLRAAHIPARYESGTVELSAEAANTYAGTESLSATLTALLSSGVQAKAVSLGKGRGLGIQMPHTWVRAFVPATSYRGVQEGMTENSWVHLGPALKRVKTEKATDVRDAVTFDFQGYLSKPNTDPPSKVYEGQVRDHLLRSSSDCQTVDGATKRRTITADGLPLLPVDLPARRVSSQGNTAVLASDIRHQVRLTGKTSQGATYSYSSPMVGLWGKSMTVVYEPATSEDAGKIAAAGGLASTPAYSIRLKGVVKVDGVAVASSPAETPGAEQSLQLDIVPPKTASSSAHYVMMVGGIYAFALDAGLVPADLVAERQARFSALSGDDLEAEKLNVIGLSYFRQLGLGRERVAGLQWHRIYKDIEVAQASVEPRLSKLGSTPVRLARDFFVFDAAQTAFGSYSVDGDHHRSSYVFKLSGFESSFLEHRISEQYKGAPAYSAVGLVQQAGSNTITFDSTSVDEALARIHAPADVLERLRDLADQGYTIVAPVDMYTAAGLGSLYGFVATSPSSGIYEVNFQGQPLNGGVGANDAPPAQSAGGNGQCSTCGGGITTGSEVNLMSGNYFDRIMDISLPSRGLPLAFVMTYSSQLGWHHNYDRSVAVQADGSLTFTDGEGVHWRFAAANSSGLWTPPPTRFQSISSAADGGYDMTFPDGLRHHFDQRGLLAYERDTNGHQIDVVRAADGRITNVRGTSPAALSFVYSPEGRLIRVEDSAGRSIGFGYNPDGTLATATDVLAHSRSFGYDTSGRMRTKTDFLGNATQIDYDDLGRTIRVQDPEGGTFKYAYDTRNRTVVYTDRMGQVHLYEIGDVGLPVRTVDPLGNETLTVFDPRGNRKQERDARGHWSYSEYNDDGTLRNHTDALGNTTTYTYAPLARLETVRDATNKETVRNTYNSAGNLIESRDALQNVTTYTYEDGLPKTITRPGSSVTEMTYWPSGNVHTIKDPVSGTTTMTYDPAGHLVGMEDPGLHSRTMVVDAKGRVTTMFDAANVPTTFSYDDNGNRLSIKQFGEVETTFGYDKLNRLVRTTDALGNTTRQQYDADGRVLVRTDARGFSTRMRYDAIGRLVSTMDPSGATSTMGYCANEAQQPCLSVDPLGNVTTLVEDELGREVERRDPLNNVTRTHYNSLGQRDTVWDPAGNPTSFGYDDAGRLSTVTDALSGLTGYGYDGRGNRTSVTDANNHTTTFTYDLANRLDHEVVPDQIMTTQYQYDAAGNRRAKIDGKAQTTGFVYDPNRRLTDINYASGAPAHFEYDEHGNKTLEKNGDSERHMRYDKLGRLVHVDDVTVGHSIDYTYDAAGNRATMTVMPENETTRYFWDDRGLLSSMIDPDGGTYRFAYDKAGRRTVTTYPNGMVLNTVYDAASRVVSMIYTSKSGGVIESFSYTYDSRGNRLSKIFADATMEEYAYDELSRLIQATYPGGRTVKYTYDAVGNRTQLVEGQASNTGPVCTGDADCDGVPDGLDNCPTTANTEQTDSDRGAAPSGLRYGLRFEETSGTAIADVKKAFTGNIVGSGTTRGPGREGGGISFPGTPRAGVKIAHGPATNITGNAISIAAWVKPASLNGGPIVSKGGQYALWAAAGPYGFKLLKTGSMWIGGYAEMPAVGQWTHVVATWDGSTVRYYLNGNLIKAEALAGGPITEAATPVLMGCNTGTDVADGQDCSQYEGFKGSVDEVGVWDRVLTLDEVHALFRKAPLVDEDGMGDACDPCSMSRDTTCAPSTCLDEDGDGYGVSGASNCGAGHPEQFDCNDHDPRVHPGAVEACDGLDNNCNSLVDDACLGTPQTTKYHYNAFNQLVKSGVPKTCPANDIDCDGVPENLDNCPNVYNPDQKNSDPMYQGAIAMWSMDESSGTTLKDLAGGHDATIVGGVSHVPGRFGQGLKFEGGRATANANRPSGPFSLELWANLTNASNNPTLIDLGELQPILDLYNGLRVLPPGYSYGTVPANAWTHLAYTWDNTRGRYYVNGVEVGTSTNGPESPGVGITMGARKSGGAPTSGTIDEVALWPRVLSAAEVSMHSQRSLMTEPGDACDPCPGNSDPACRPTACVDNDGDGYGIAGATNCAAGHPELVDCNDNNASIHPGAFDIDWDGVDNDCNGYADDPMQSTTTYQWDGNGNLVSDGTTTYTWDARDRLTGTSGSTGAVSYGYDPRGMRASIADAVGRRNILLGKSKTSTSQLIGATDDEIVHYSEDGTQMVRYDRDPVAVDTLMAQKKNGTKVYALLDELGSVYALVDGNGHAVARYQYDVFGTRTTSVETIGTSWGFTGRIGDSASTVYFRSRQMATDIGIFTQRDGFGYAAGTNLYAYAGGNPVNSVDPAGTFAIGSLADGKGWAGLLADAVRQAYRNLAYVHSTTSGFLYQEGKTCGKSWGIFDKKCWEWKFFEWKHYLLSARYAPTLVDVCEKGTLPRGRAAATEVDTDSVNRGLYYVMLGQAFLNPELLGGSGSAELILTHEFTHIGLFQAPEWSQRVRVPTFKWCERKEGCFFEDQLTEIGAWASSVAAGESDGNAAFRPGVLVPELGQVP